MVSPTVRAFSRIAGVLPHGASQGRAAYALIQRRRLSGVAEQTLTDGTRFELDLSDSTQALAFLTRRYTPELARWVSGRLPADGTFFDVGANVGLITFQVQRQRPSARVVAFEPLPENAERWLRNRELNAANATLEQAALADRIGSARFERADDSGWGHLNDSGAVDVAVTTLDQHCAQHGIEHIDVLKLDAEGGEPAILDGAARLLGRGAIEAIVTELHRSNSDAILRRLSDYDRVPLPRLGLYRVRRPDTLDGAFVRRR